ncbi:uncharacterized protein CRV24_008119 [Beauveria bassiana]|nr:uncharacterized protein CRV24_008119 [Beauveria bassiana]
MSQDFRTSSIGRRLKNSSKDSSRRIQTKSKSNIVLVEHDEARSFALRTAYLHYLLQPKAKRKQYVAPPKPPARTHTSVGQLVQEYVSGSAYGLKLPSNFPNILLDRVGGVLKGSERLPGFNDAAVKRCFAEAYTAFSEKNFRRTIEKERKFEPLVLIFYSSATKAAQRGRAPDDDSWKLLPDRHLALFVRLAATILRDQGHERDKSELLSRLTTLENKLLTNDQDLVSSGSDSAGTTIEVVVPLSYDVKDMPMVQIVAAIFGLSLSEVQAEINEKRSIWNEEAALKDLKTYQQRLNSNGSGALRSNDFDVEESFTEWQKSEAHFLSQMMLEILTAKPELAKSSPSADKPLTSRPQSMYVEDQAYADLSRAISSVDTPLGFDPLASISSISSDANSIRTVDQGDLYTFIPSDPRAFYKYILQHAMAFDQLRAPSDVDYQPLSKQTMDFMTELCCYDSTPPNIGAVMFILENHLYQDEIFTPRPEAIAEFTESLTIALRNKAVDVYRESMRKEIPVVKEQWEFAHVVKLGKTITKLCDRIRKRYKNNLTIMGVDPFAILVEEVFPNCECDAGAILETILGQAQASGEDIDIEDGFELYKELVAIRDIHQKHLPHKPFAFNVENLLVDFVWRWVRSAEAKMTNYVDEAIKQDQFQVRIQHGDHSPRDSERHSVSVIDIFMLFNQTVDQVFQLKWDNDEHNARFMTALARSFSAGLGRYCEVLELQFSKEMDRPSAEELAMQTKSTQEKWMQYAKDAWNNKEKAEPFQFFAESFVKLNNIEFAMQELDKLEKSMHSDACAELLEKIDGPRKQTRKPSKYTFTIKVVEAEDLKACDPSGYSDPYVVFGDEVNKRLYKTRIIYKNLNPRWDESFEFTVQGPVNLIATVWDYDTFGNHDCAGRTSLKIDPVHFGDYLPREFWLDLDTQGRVLIRVSMEGERDDIQFHFGKAFRHLKRAERDMVRKITDKLTSQINSTLSVETLRGILGLNGLGSQVTNLWKKRTSTLPVVTPAHIENALKPLFDYFNDNFTIMKQTLTDATMIAVMTRLWKEVLLTIENLLVPPVSDKPSTQKALSRKELDIVYQWLELLFVFFNAKEQDSGEQLGVPAEVLKSPKWHELASLNFFYFEDTNSLIRESERMASATAQRAQQALLSNQQAMRHSAPPGFGAALGGAGAFASMGTIRRGKSIMMSRNLGTMRQAKEAKRRETQADPSDDMILRILRMRPEAAHYLKERHRQKERQAATAAAALIVKNSVTQGWNTGLRAGASFGRMNLPRR